MVATLLHGFFRVDYLAGTDHSWSEVSLGRKVCVGQSLGCGGGVDLTSRHLLPWWRVYCRVVADSARAAGSPADIPAITSAAEGVPELVVVEADLSVSAASTWGRSGATCAAAVAVLSPARCWSGEGALLREEFPLREPRLQNPPPRRRDKAGVGDDGSGRERNAQRVVSLLLAQLKRTSKSLQSFFPACVGIFLAISSIFISKQGSRAYSNAKLKT
jgi:hypothetical protein